MQPERYLTRRKFCLSSLGALLPIGEIKEPPNSFTVESLTFHEIIDPKIYHDEVTTMLENGYTPIGVKDISLHFQHHLDLSNRKSFFITLDDGLTSQLTALQLNSELEALYGLPIPMLFAVMTKFDGHSDDAITDDCPSFTDDIHTYMNKEDILTILTYDQHDIANHTLNHADLPALSPSNLLGELQISERRITNLYKEVLRDRHPKVLVYPMGKYSPQVQTVVNSLGIDLAFTTQQNQIYSERNRLSLGRRGVT